MGTLEIEPAETYDVVTVVEWSDIKQTGFREDFCQVLAIANN